MTATFDDPSVTFDDPTVTFEGELVPTGAFVGSLPLLFSNAGTEIIVEPPPPTPEEEAAAAVGMPTIRVLVAFTGSEETDITSDVLSLVITRGRSRERETMSPGRAEIRLWNFDGAYDPDNISGPYYPNIRPNKVVRVIAGIDSETTPFRIGSSELGGGDAFGGGAIYDVILFTGRLEGGALTYEEGGLQPRVTWRAIDASKRLNRDRSTTGYGTAGELTGARVTAVLDGATPTWADSLRDIAAGTKHVQYAEGDQGRYDYMLTVAASEVGAFFIARDGSAVFRDSTWDPDPATPVLGYAVGEYKFASIEVTDDETEIYNAVTVTASSLTDETMEDISSQADLGRSDLSISTVLDTQAEMSDVATTFLNAYSQPRRRISQLRAGRVIEDWMFFLSKELLDRVIVRHRPIYGGTFEQESVIQGIQIAINDSQNWEVTWNLTPPIQVISNPNLLTDNQASMETDTSGWVVTNIFFDFLGYNYAITGQASGSVPLVGTYALEMRATGVPTIGGTVTTTPYNTVPVTVGETYRASAWVRSYFGTIYFNVGINWYNAGGTLIGGTGEGPIVGLSGGYPDGVTEWRPATVEGIAPTGAVYGAVAVTVYENGYIGDSSYISRPHYIDAVELRHVGI